MLPMKGTKPIAFTYLGVFPKTSIHQCIVAVQHSKQHRQYPCQSRIVPSHRTAYNAKEATP